MQTRRFDFNFQPLKITVSFVNEGSVPGSQNYNADYDEYTPDYTITPLIIMPKVGIIDKDGIMPSGNVNYMLCNIRWKEIINGTARNIAASETYYEYETSGGNAGRLKMKKNASPRVPITLQFYGEFVDPRNDQINVIQRTYLIKCGSASEHITVKLDAPAVSIYDPLIDDRLRTVTAKVFVGERICPAGNYLLNWEVIGEDGTWHAAGSDELFDYYITANGNAATVDRWLMGDNTSIRCRCRYSPDGNPSSISLDDSTPQAVVSFVRRIAKFEYDIAGVPTNIPAGSLRFVAMADIHNTNGTMNNVLKELLPLWYIATNKVSGALSYTQVAHGLEASISTKPLSQSYGAVIALDVVDRGYMGALNDFNDDSIITDSDGKILLI